MKDNEIYEDSDVEVKQSVTHLFTGLILAVGVGFIIFSVIVFGVLWCLNQFLS